MIITCDTKVFFTDGWNFDWVDMPANLEREPLSIVTCGHVDSGKSTTTGCLFLELGGIPERELDKLKQDEERLKKSSLVYIFFMAKQKEEWERGVNTTCTRMSSSQTSGITPSSILPTRLPSWYQLIENPIRRQTNDTNAGEIQGQTRQHSRPGNLLGMKQTYNDSCGTAGCKHEWCEEISNDLKNKLNKCQHSNTMPNLNVRCSTHSWFTPDSLFATNSSTSFVCRIRFNTAVTVEMRMLCNSVRDELFFDGVETPQARTAQLVSFCSCVWQAQTAH